MIYAGLDARYPLPDANFSNGSHPLLTSTSHPCYLHGSVSIHLSIKLIEVIYSDNQYIMATQEITRYRLDITKLNVLITG